MAVIRELLDASDLQHTDRGLTVTRSWLVTEQTGDATSRAFQAQRSVVRYQEPHPTIDGLFALDIQARMESGSPSTVRVIAEYREPQNEDQNENSEDVIEIGAAVVQVPTQLDVNGKPLEVQFTFLETTKNADGDDQEQEVTDTQVATVDVSKAQGVLRVVRVERDNPFNLQLRYVGRINSRRWNQGAPGTWQCVRIQGRTDDGGRTYTNTYEFQYNEDGWDPVIAYISPDTGQVPQGINARNGLRRVELFRRADFGRLRIRVR